jgi:hypothetical protein
MAKLFVTIILIVTLGLINKYILDGDRIDFATMLLGAILYRVNTLD